MYGETINTLNVYTKTIGGDEAVQWSKTGDQGNQWKLGNFTSNPDTSFQVVMLSYNAKLLGLYTDMYQKVSLHYLNTTDN